MTLKVSLLVNTLITNVLYSYTTNYITNITSIITTNRNGKRITYTTNYISNVTTTVTTNTSESVINSINPAVVQPPTGQSSLMNASAQTEQSSSAILAISWLATANTVYQVEFATNLSLVNWQLLLAYTNNAPTNRTVMVFDTNAPAGAPSRFYRVSHP